MSRDSIRAGFLLAVSAIQILACSDATENAGNVVIGVIAPVVRNQATIDGATLAADEINAAGGLEVGGRRRKIELIVEDSESSPETAVSKALQLIRRDRVVALFGVPRSHNAIPVAKLAELHETPLISTMSTHPETTEGKRYVFRLAFLDSFQGKVMADFAFHDLGARSAAALVDAAGAYSTSLAAEFTEAFTRHGGRVAASEIFTEDNLDVARQLSSIQESGAEVLFLPNYSEVVVLHAREARRLGLASTFLGGDTWNNERLLEVSRELGGSYFSDFWAPDRPQEKTAAFIERYRRAFGGEPSSAAALSYDAVALIVEAIRRQGRADRQAIRAGLAAMGAFQGVSGAFEFKGSGDPVRSVFIRKIDENGEVRLYKEIGP